jgi:RHH-type proline utilization regulon transcriptional repressor/proline dehydrogenase/delta 1-pyrroline-5-carboxylate dehydrogenase
MTADQPNMSAASALPIFKAPYAAPDEALAADLLATAALPAEAEARIDQRATTLIAAIRARSSGLGGIEDFLREYSLATKEGLALMV